MGSAVAEEEGRVEGVPTASSSQALRLTARRSAVGRAMRDEAVVRMGSSWQEREAASMGRKPDRAPAAAAEERTEKPRNHTDSGVVAEDGGFEPPRACTQHAFQACAIGH